MEEVLSKMRHVALFVPVIFFADGNELPPHNPREPAIPEAVWKGFFPKNRIVSTVLKAANVEHIRSSAVLLLCPDRFVDLILYIGGYPLRLQAIANRLCIQQIQIALSEYTGRGIPRTFFFIPANSLFSVFKLFPEICLGPLRLVGLQSSLPAWDLCFKKGREPLFDFRLYIDMHHPCRWK